jgi:hypothetical protein
MGRFGAEGRVAQINEFGSQKLVLVTFTKPLGLLADCGNVENSGKAKTV